MQTDPRYASVDRQRTLEIALKPLPVPNYAPGDLVPLREVYSDPRTTPPRRGLLPAGRTTMMKLLREGVVRSVRLGQRSVFVPYDEILRVRSEGAPVEAPTGHDRNSTKRGAR